MIETPKKHDVDIACTSNQAQKNSNRIDSLILSGSEKNGGRVKTDSSFLRKIISVRLVAVYIAFFLLCYYVFTPINQFYLHSGYKTFHPIDSHFFINRQVDPAYIVTGKLAAYDHDKYFHSFFLLDLIFPIIYTLLFLSVLAAHNKKWFYAIALSFIIAGGSLDYLENFMFGYYLTHESSQLPLIISWIIAVKTVLFLLNIVGFLTGFVWLIVKKLSRPTK